MNYTAHYIVPPVYVFAASDIPYRCFIRKIRDCRLANLHCLSDRTLEPEKGDFGRGLELLRRDSRLFRIW